MSFPKREKLSLQRDFQRIFKKGSRVAAGRMTLFHVCQEPPRNYPRLGIVVSRRIGKAVLRNRIKRWIREVYVRHKAKLPEGVDIVLRPQVGIKWPGIEEAERDVLKLLSRAGLVDRF